MRHNTKPVVASCFLKSLTFFEVENLMGTLDLPSSGRITFDGREVTRLTSRQLASFRNRSLGFVFQFHHLLREFTAPVQLEFPRSDADLALLLRSDPDPFSRWDAGQHRCRFRCFKNSLASCPQSREIITPCVGSAA